MRARGLALIGLFLAGCVHDDLVVCADGNACAPGLTCVSDPDLPYTTCASNEQREPCDGKATHDDCQLNGVPGSCFGGACIPAVCGDNIIEAHEVCDDGNTLGGDGCSADCKSGETCGDGTIDLARGEQCDDGVIGRSGDGCSSQCKVEFATWTDVTPGNPSDRGGVQIAATSNGILMYGGSTMALPPISSATFNDTWFFDGVTWKNMNPIDHPPPLVRGAMAYDPRHDEVVLFGGFDATATRKDETWVWDGVNWKRRMPVNKPPTLADASMACSPTKCVLFGGDTTGNLPQNKTYEWDGTNWITLTPTTPPSARFNSGLIYFPPQDKFLLVGQAATMPTTMEVWELSGNWIQLPMTTPPPVSTNSAPIGLAYEQAVGGQVEAVVNGSVYLWAGGTTTTWAQLPPPTAAVNVYAVLNPISHHASVFAPLEVQTPREYNGSAWTTLSIVRPTGDLSTDSGAYDSARGVTVVLDRTSGTWEWDGVAWHQRRTTAASPPNTDIAVAYDSKCGRTVAFGGTISATTFSSTTSYWDGTNWTAQSFSGPEPRTKAAMVYDSARDAIVLFGGNDVSTRFADTWELTGPCDARTWTTRNAPGPAGRSSHAMAYDEARHVTMLFGGASPLPVASSPTAMDDTWQWDGTAWTQLAPATSPGKRLDHAMAFDPRTRDVVMVGGRVDPSVATAQTLLPDVWEWRKINATTYDWVEIKSLVTFTRHAGHMLVPDRSGALMTFGGVVPTGTGSIDVTRMDYAQIEHPVETCELATDDLDGDGLTSCADPDCRSRCAPLCSTSAKFGDCTGPTCGDGVCSAVEDYLLCPADCPVKL